MMSNTSRSKNLLVIIAVLLLTNIGMLVYFLWYKPSEKPPVQSRERAGIGDLLQKEVGFTDEQFARYKTMKEEQRQTIRPMFDHMRKAKDSLFRLLSDDAVTDSMLMKATDAIAIRQKAVDLQTFDYFKRVRSLCTAEQEPKYDTMIVRMFRKMGKPQREDGDKSEKKN